MTEQDTQQETWQVHVLGPDDVLHAASRIDALQQAHQLNAFMLRQPASTLSDPMTPLVWAVPERQPSSPLGPSAGPGDLLEVERARVARYAEWAEVDERVSPLWKDATLRWKRRAESAEAEVERLRVRLAKVEALHTCRPWDFAKDSTTFGQTEYPDRCDHCHRAWPCETVAAIADAPTEQTKGGE